MIKIGGKLDIKYPIGQATGARAREKGSDSKMQNHRRKPPKRTRALSRSAGRGVVGFTICELGVSSEESGLDIGLLGQRH